ncbi:MAG: tyrosine-type recombinase/integrase [Candidatus Acidiferrales bacterium]
MPTPCPSLYIRQKLSSGRWRYRRIKEGRGLKTGDIPAPFFIRPFVNGKQIWKKLAAETLREAKEEAGHLAIALDAQSKGLTVEEAEGIASSNRVPIRTAVDTYLEHKSSKSPKTVAAYRLILNEFIRSLNGKARFLDEITEDVLRNYKRFMGSEGYAGKTIDTRLNVVFFLLKKNSIKARIPRDEMPVIEDETAVPYTEEELEKLFAAMDAEETVRYKFFLGTGCREREVSFASWQDINWGKGEYHIRRKDDVGFTPKSHESRTVPMPKSLVTLLKNRHSKAPHDRWIFVNRDGRPDGHFLRKLKRIAKRAGLNCGQCKTKITVGRYEKKQVEVSCKDQPVCSHFYLHRFRKTCATRWVEAGIPIRTVQAWLGHKNLQTTMIYLGVTDSTKLRGQIDAAFGD